MSRARDLASNVTALDAQASDATALGALRIVLMKVV